MKNNSKTYFAQSDIHGRDISIEKFEACGFDLNDENHIIVLVGDYFDRWEKTMLVLRFIEKYKKLLGDRFIVLKGNHDEFVINFINHIKANCEVGDPLVHDEVNLDRWLRNGGDITIRHLFGPYKGKYTEAKHKKLLRLEKFVSLIDDYYETKDYIFTHAAIDEERNVDTWARDFFDRGVNIDKTIIIGHTTHKYLVEDVEFIQTDYGVIAKSLKETLCPVLNIDNGLGNNIVVFEEK